MLSKTGKILRKIRIDHDELLYDMAKKLGMSSAMLSEVETGKRCMNQYSIDLIAQIYCLTDEQLNELRKEQND